MKILNLSFKKVPKGFFYMGTPFCENKIRYFMNKYKIFPEWILKEMPQRHIFLDEFWIMENNVTFRDLSQFFLNYPGFKSPEIINFEKKYGLDHPAFPIDSKLANKYTEWLSSKTKLNIYVPSEYQWEKAARGTDKREFPWGNKSNGPVRIKSNHFCLPDFSDKFKNISPYGIKYMAGNLEEVTSSRNCSYNGLQIHVPKNLEYTILRGGTCEHDLDLTRCARRHGKIPSTFTGLRLSMSFKPIIKNEKRIEFKIGGYSFSSIIKIHNNQLVLAIGDKIGFCPLSAIALEEKILISNRKIGSEILIKLESFTENGNILCSKPKIENYHEIFVQK